MQNQPLKSGLDAQSQCVLGESPKEFAELQAGYFDRFAPATPEQRFHVDSLIRHEWLLRRYHRVEAQLWQYQTTLCDRAAGVQLGEAYTKASTLFQRLHRQIKAVEKAYADTMTSLKQLQIASQPEEIKTQTAKLASFRQVTVLPPESQPLSRPVPAPEASRSASQLVPCRE
jgi:hypothetical protein